MLLLLFLFGLMLGSFVNALVWRLKNERNWITERSECPHCHHLLSAKDLVPVLSWITLRGRCRYCHRKISIQYPLVELLVGLSFAASYIFWPYGLDTTSLVRFIFWQLALVILAALFVYDLKWMKFPTILLNTLILLGIMQLVVLALSSDDPRGVAIRVLVSALLGGGLFYLIHLATKGKAIGDGDAFLGIGFGLLLADPGITWIAITLASIIGSIVALVFIAKGRSRHMKVPFGPFLITGVYLAGLFGPTIWSWMTGSYL